MVGLIEYTTQGRVGELGTQLPLKNVTVTLNGFKTQTDEQGRYKFKFEVESNFDESPTFGITSPTPLEVLNVKLSKEGYESETFSPQYKDKTIKQNQVLVLLKPKQKDLSSQEAELSLYKKEDITKAQDKASTSQDVIQKLVLKQVDTIILRMIPVAISIIAAFGLTSLDKVLNGDFKDKTCPNRENLLRLIKKRNKLVKQLNNIYNLVNTMIVALGVFSGLVTIFKAVKQVFLKLPIPSTIGTPPGPGGGVIYSATIGQVLTVEDNVKKFEKVIDKFQQLSIVGLASLALLSSILKRLIDLLKIGDLLLEECSNGETFIQEEIDPQLLESIRGNVDEVDNNASELVVNGFTFAVLTEKDKDTDLERRYAVAKNSLGGILLKGEPSFSSEDQILIDELAFYVRINNLKAF